jgi:hypothetical protein
VFALLAVAGAVVAVVPRELPDTVAFDVDTVRAASGRKIAPLLGCVALTLVFVGQGSVWNYIVRIGNGLGIDAHTLGVLLALVPPLAMLGPLASHVLGERVGLLWPLLLSLAVLAADAFLLSSLKVSMRVVAWILASIDSASCAGVPDCGEAPVRDRRLNSNRRPHRRRVQILSVAFKTDRSRQFIMAPYSPV